MSENNYGAQLRKCQKVVKPALSEVVWDFLILLGSGPVMTVNRWPVSRVRESHDATINDNLAWM